MALVMSSGLLFYILLGFRVLGVKPAKSLAVAVAVATGEVSDL